MDPSVDYDEEGMRILAALNLEQDGTIQSRYNDSDVLWKHPETKAAVYIGNETSSKNLFEIEKLGVSSIVNCTRNMPNFHEENEKLSYFRFIITSFYERRDLDDPEKVLEFFTPVFEFIDNALSKGSSVLVHCLAGAHRSGATGIAFLMHKTGWNLEEAKKAAKSRRSIINPLGMERLLKVLDIAIHRRNEASQ